MTKKYDLLSNRRQLACHCSFTHQRLVVIQSFVLVLLATSGFASGKLKGPHDRGVQGFIGYKHGKKERRKEVIVCLNDSITDSLTDSCVCPHIDDKN